ncbi:xyloglucan galactosyltransferase KATAMARI1-like protein [Pyrus ussuriensis x Pyrus communis]|uniref:Xyloglucan galactosyltransferase KATAMARI1-like protein n=1 Tax=Pyrus ussuriensis x Pyrus communis TaxID=2448454 RepID=A0A5N5HAD7_9ROSA|nr:xyloglucan galactosyltransferase KATAMARI1-like protein [Pyrus ussuriensis x Pyrus communis]
MARKVSQEVWVGIIVSFYILCISFFCLMYSTSLGANNVFNLLVNKQVHLTSTMKINHTDDDSCLNRYIYIHDGLPARFNYDFLNNCESLSPGTSSSNKPSMCPHLVNLGACWFVTNPYLLEVIFHNRMKKYECLTRNSTLASAIYVPFYPSMDVGVHLWDSNIEIRDSSAKEFVKWLSGQPEWTKMWGRDHFFASGRISWDFRRQRDNSSNWGSKLRFLPESLNMTMLSIEGSRWKNDIAIPYPTNFHPSNDSEVVQWQDKVRKQERPYLFTFAGAPRPNQQGSIRGKLIQHCQASTNCNFLHCTEKICGNPITVMRAFQSSVYCLQPAGDSFTRRSTFDAFLAGCIPVFFHPATAYTQYLWYLPKNHSKYSVYIPVRDVTDLKEGSIEKILLGISKDRELAMREEVIKLIPKLVYADPRSRLETEDAFDIAVRGILERIGNVSKEIKEGRDPSIGFADEDNSKVTFPKTIEKPT